MILTALLCLSCAAVTAQVEVKADYTTPCSACGGRGYTRCFTCGGIGFQQKSEMVPQTTYVQQMTGVNPVTGMMQYTMVPRTTYTYQTRQVPCTSCGGSGRGMICTSCNGTGMKTVRTGGGSSSGGSSSGGSSSGGSSSGGSSSGGSSSGTVETKTFSGGNIVLATKGVVSSEEATYLVDGKKDTKYNVKSTKAFVIWRNPKLLAVSSYVLTTANDTATYTGRNPKSWTLYGSNKKLSRNSKGWVKLHSVKNDTILKPVNFKDYTYKIGKTQKPFYYYKLEITENKGADCTQLAELTLKGSVITSKATAFTSLKRSTTTLKTYWKKVSPVSGYQIQYSLDSNFKSSKCVTVTGGTKTSKMLKGLTKGKTYYVRIRSFRNSNGAKVYSDWSKAKKV